MDDGDLGFRWQRLKQGEVCVRHAGRLAATLRGAAAIDFLAEMETATSRRNSNRWRDSPATTNTATNTPPSTIHATGGESVAGAIRLASPGLMVQAR